MVPYGYLTDVSPAEVHTVQVSEERLIQLLRLFLATVRVDEEWYRRTYGDVDQAIRDGKLASAKDHYILAGYFEDRLPRPVVVNARWYTKEYPDVAAGINKGELFSAEQHFNLRGFREGRRPYLGWSIICDHEETILDSTNVRSVLGGK